MENKVTLYPALQRAALAVLGTCMVVLCLSCTLYSEAPFAIGMYAVFTVLSVWFTYLGVRVGVTVDRSGLTERRMGRTVRTSWRDLGEPAVAERVGNAGQPYHLVVFAHRTAGELPLRSTARYRRADAEKLRDRMARLREQAGPRRR